MSRLFCLLAIVATLKAADCGHRRARSPCAVFADVEGGRVCGTRRVYAPREGLNVPYASFRGVPYAKQPLGELRFKELQPVEDWDGEFNASEEGPICPQHDVLYGPLMKPHSMGEDCIRVNVHVPFHALPGQLPPTDYLQPPKSLAEGLESASSASSEERNTTTLPILVFIHGGGFALGSGDSDFYGPEYLVSEDIIVITFNYRLGPIGFLSLNSPAIPGNLGLRDQLTLLRWVQRNARAFGGDPSRVTLGGQSAGACSAQLLSLSKASEGLFKNALLMSGSATRSFYSTSPLYADFVSKQFLLVLGINATDPDQIHDELVKVPIDILMDVNRKLQDQFGIGVFFPVIESQHPGVTPVIDDDPEVLQAAGRGSHIPFMVGFTNDEGLVFKNRFENIHILDQLNKNPMLMVPPYLLFKTTPQQQKQILKNIKPRYPDSSKNIDEFLRYISEAIFEYPAMNTAQKRAAVGGAPAYLYQFSYTGQFRVVETAARRSFGKGATHTEDLTYIMKVNSIPEPAPRRVNGQLPDYQMRHWMTTLVANFVRCSNPSGGKYDHWLPVNREKLEYQDIRRPYVMDMSSLTDQQAHMVELYDHLYDSVLKVKG